MFVVKVYGQSCDWFLAVGPTGRGITGVLAKSAALHFTDENTARITAQAARAGGLFSDRWEIVRA